MFNGEDDEDVAPASEEMYSLLLESVALLEGLVLKDQRPRVFFDWTDLAIYLDEEDDPMEMLVDFPLLRLPIWMEFEIVINPDDGFEQGDVEGWLDKFCPNSQMRSRIRVKK